VFHTFVIGVYLFPLLGGWISDRFLGKYRTILWLSLLYCVGHACLAILREPEGGLLHSGCS
jgi:POT family proton-dependent oligopeptide transporter